MKSLQTPRWVLLLCCSICPAILEQFPELVVAVCARLFRLTFVLLLCLTRQYSVTRSVLSLCFVDFRSPFRSIFSLLFRTTFRYLCHPSLGSLFVRFSVFVSFDFVTIDSQFLPTLISARKSAATLASGNLRVGALC
jgi:hypothetical protein